jgi:hypothetical protein
LYKNCLYTIEEFKIAKSRELIPFKCPICSKIFYRPKNYVQQKIKKGIIMLYCSSHCSATNPEKDMTFNCECCGKDIYRKKSQLKKVKHYFCSRSCAAKYNNAHKSKGYRRSKLEKYIEANLTEIFPNLEILYNDRKTLPSGLELDIYVPSLKLAFELNGVFHYIPIFGKDKLNLIQDSDYIKMSECQDLDINICVIDVSKEKHFTEKRGIKYLEIIKSFISSK